MSCPECGGRGWLVSPDGGAGAARRCPCQGPSLDRAMAAAGVLPKYRRCTWATWRGARPALEGWPSADRWLVTILGPVGVGKTHIATALLAERLTAGDICRWRDVGELIEDLKASFDEGGRARVLEPLKAADLLVLDDLTAKHLTDWSRFECAHLIRWRDSRQLPTIWTASATLEDLQDPGLASRCAAQEVLNLAGADRRLETN